MVSTKITDPAKQQSKTLRKQTNKEKKATKNKEDKKTFKLPDTG
jgi:hypothetical protein